MPINRQAMVDGLQGLYGDTDAAAQAWADALTNGFLSIVPASTTVASAKPALKDAIKTAFDAELCMAGLETALHAFASTVGGGMAGFAAVPPSGQVGFATLFVPPFPETRADSAGRIADAVIAWAVTGTATLTAPPATTSNWA